MFAARIPRRYGRNRLRRNALSTTETELNAIAAAQSTGLRRGPPNAQNTPAANGMQMTL